MSDDKFRKDEGKTRWDLVPMEEMEEIAKVMTYGATKYPEDSWKGTPNFNSRVFSAMMRHLAAWRKGELLDAESKLPHLAHLATNALFLRWKEKYDLGSCCGSHQSRKDLLGSMGTASVAELHACFQETAHGLDMTWPIFGIDSDRWISGGRSMKMPERLFCSGYRVYVAGPYTAKDEESTRLNITRAYYVGAHFMSCGFPTFVPHMNSALLQSTKANHEFWIDMGRAFLSCCKAVYVLPGWSYSHGTLEEMKHARNEGIPIWVHTHGLIRWEEDTWISRLLSS